MAFPSVNEDEVLLGEDEFGTRSAYVVGVLQEFVDEVCLFGILVDDARHDVDASFFEDSGVFFAVEGEGIE